MAKEKKLTTRFGFELEYNEEVIPKKELPKSQGGAKVHPAIVDIFKRLEKKEPEDVMKFVCANEEGAGRLKQMLVHYRMSRDIQATVGQSGTTVYLYKKLED